MHWDRLSLEQMQERIDWLRDGFEAGRDWGFCPERRICVLMNESTIMLYKLRWFEANNQEEIPSGIYGAMGEPI